MKEGRKNFRRNDFKQPKIFKLIFSSLVLLLLLHFPAYNLLILHGNFLSSLSS